MNILKDIKKLINKNLNKYIKNSGYGDGAGGYKKRVWQGFPYTSKNPISDQEEHIGRLRERCRSCWYQYGLARCIISTFTDWAIGSGLEMRSEAPEKYRAQLTEAWEKWSGSRESDSRADSCFYLMQREIVSSMLLNGDVFLVLHRKETEPNKYELKIEAVEADNIKTPTDALEKEKKIINGIELNRYNEPIAFWFEYDEKGEKKFSRIKKENAEGLKVIHYKNRERIGSIRGVPILAPCLESLVQINRYCESELQTSLLESLFSIIIKSDEPAGGTIEQPIPPDPYSVQMGSGNVNFVPLDTEVTTIDGKRSQNATSLEKYVETVLKASICPAVNIPYEILVHEFNSSYSASRASILLFNRTAQNMRDAFCLDVMDGVFRAFCELFMLNNNILDASLDEMTKCSWLGPTPPSLDQNKEAQFFETCVKNGWLTNKAVAQELFRVSFSDNVKELKTENEALAAAGAKSE